MRRWDCLFSCAHCVCLESCLTCHVILPKALLSKSMFLLSPQPFLFERCVFPCTFMISSPTERQKTMQLTLQSSTNAQLACYWLRGCTASKGYEQCSSAQTEQEGSRLPSHWIPKSLCSPAFPARGTQSEAGEGKTCLYPHFMALME